MLLNMMNDLHWNFCEGVGQRRLALTLSSNAHLGACIHIISHSH